MHEKTLVPPDVQEGNLGVPGPLRTVPIITSAGCDGTRTLGLGHDGRRPRASSGARPSAAGCLALLALLATVVLLWTAHGLGCHGAQLPRALSSLSPDDAARSGPVLSPVQGSSRSGPAKLPTVAVGAPDYGGPEDDGPDVVAELLRREGRLGKERRQSASNSSGTVLVNVQVHQPVLTPEGATLDSGVSNGEAGDVQDSCQVVLMERVFAYSYGDPFIGNYTPPDCKFNRVTMNYTVVSEGRQFDRLALMYFNDTEVWRTSTSEPTSAPGIRWTYLKDMTEYLSIWQEPQKLIFDLGNLITDIYTASFNTTLTATFFYDDGVDVATAAPADLIIPISARQSASDAVSQFTLPADNATNTVAFPQNVKRAVFSVSANGQSNEEFWWSNVLQSGVDTFSATAGSFPGYSPWREVQVLIDGQLAGVDWPFPVVFTGGVVPSLHRPVAGPDAYDLKEHEIDITPWLGVLCDGNNHTFTINVAGLLDDGASTATIAETVGSSWYVTGKIFVWLDDEGSVTTGSAPVVAGTPQISVSQSITQTSNGTNDTLTYGTEVSRSFSVTADIVTAQNVSSTVSWTQSLSYSNKGYVTDQGYKQINDFLTSGSDAADTSSDVAGADYAYQYKWPLWCNTSVSYSAQGNLTLFGQLIQGQEIYVSGAAVYPDGLEAFAVDGTSYSGSLANTTKDGIAYFFEYADNTVSSGFGSTDQVFSFGGFTGSAGGSIDTTPDEQLYYRHLEAANSTVTLDDEEMAPASVGAGDVSGSSSVSGSASAFVQAPLGGGNGAPRIFMNRQGS